MKRLTLLSASAAILVLALSSGATAGDAKGQVGFDKLKTLVGEWEGQAEDGSSRAASYELISGGTALMETLKAESEAPMVTIYHLDDDRVALTHYCTGNNQPRMQTEPLAGDPKVLDFMFTGGTNLNSTDHAHISGLVVTFQDKNHFTQKWTWKETSKDHFTTVHFTRKK